MAVKPIAWVAHHRLVVREDVDARAEAGVGNELARPLYIRALRKTFRGKDSKDNSQHSFGPKM